MDEKLVVQFLAKEAIKEKNKNGRLWDAIYKAHLDTVTGARTGNIPNYCAENCGGANKAIDLLYNTINKQTDPLCSQPLIDAIQKAQKQIEFAAVQKLVNMTLKYIIVLNMVECDSEFPDVCEEKCDCPIDSIILDKLYERNKIKHCSWTKMEEDEYKDIQNEIKGILDKEYPDCKGNIWFDFLMWKTK